MTTTAIGSVACLGDQVRSAVADVLRVSPDVIGDDTSFASLGLDSLTAAELSAAIEDVTGIEVALSAVHEHRTVAELVRYLEGDAVEDRSVFDRMRADAILADDIRPNVGAGTQPVPLRDARCILLTGATGFLGAYLLRTLLDETDATILCLARSGKGMSAHQRIIANLERYRVMSPRASEARRGVCTSSTGGTCSPRDLAPGDDSAASRMHVVDGDLTLPLFGLSQAGFTDLATRVDAVIHCGAQVDWVSSYDALRAANVQGTEEVLRFACRGTPKPVHFVSSLSVCYSLEGPRIVCEGQEALPFAEGLRLGYAQSKCVAESLVMEAGRRGLPVSIMRPALVSGDSVTGLSNTDDLLTRFIRGCVAMKCAPDLDWRVDCLPVDHVARAIVRLALSHDDAVMVPHISAARPRHWRECVLWMRLCGYDIDLVPYDEWSARLRAEATPGHPLHPLRSFFLSAISGGAGLTLPEAYQDGRRAHVRDDRSRARLDRLDAGCATVGTALLDRYFAQYVADGVLPPSRSFRRLPALEERKRRSERSEGPARPRSPKATETTHPCIDDLLPQIEQSLQRRHDDASLRITGITLTPLGGEDSIISEITSWREGAAIGLFRGEVALSSRRGAVTARAVVKIKPPDARVIEVAECVAALASADLGREFARCSDAHGLTRGDVRELALYRDTDHRMRAHTPELLAGSHDRETGRVTLVLEEIPSTALFDARAESVAWDSASLRTAIEGAAQIHPIWYGRATDLAAQPWLAPVRSRERLQSMAPFWRASADHALTHAPAWRNAFVARAHTRLLDAMPGWADALTALPRTLIHNDFNPRNVAIRHERKPRLCVFDWELATLGLPQRDLAELLCWTLSADASRADVAVWVERSREQLGAACGTRIDPVEWETGFRAALCELLVDRLAMYAMIDRFRPQPFLPRIVRTWTMLYRHFPWGPS
ncbi:MAG: thioester reductase domain-containing protein [Gemmatimonadota bacterium]